MLIIEQVRDGTRYPLIEGVLNRLPGLPRDHREDVVARQVEMSSQRLREPLGQATFELGAHPSFEQVIEKAYPSNERKTEQFPWASRSLNSRLMDGFDPRLTDISRPCMCVCSWSNGS